jgi:hypothetical protein
MNPIKVYLDTNIYKFSATQLPRLRPRQQTITWGDIVQEVTVHDFIEVDPNDKIQNQELKNEAELLPKLAELGEKGAVRYFIQIEALLESWGIPNMDSRTGKFYGAPVEQVEAPVKYGRVILGGNQDAKEMQFNFLSGLNHKRFIELQKVTGAYQGPGKLNRNQLLDAFHIWCAEHNECEFFLTLDFKLIRIVTNNRSYNSTVKLVRPSELLNNIKTGT